jgi:hypothetical protein
MQSSTKVNRAPTRLLSLEPVKRGKPWMRPSGRRSRDDFGGKERATIEGGVEGEIGGSVCGGIKRHSFGPAESSLVGEESFGRLLLLLSLSLAA